MKLVDNFRTYKISHTHNLFINHVVLSIFYLNVIKALLTVITCGFIMPSVRFTSTEAITIINLTDRDDRLVIVPK